MCVCLCLCTSLTSRQILKLPDAGHLLLITGGPELLKITRRKADVPLPAARDRGGSTSLPDPLIPGNQKRGEIRDPHPAKPAVEGGGFAQYCPGSGTWLSHHFEEVWGRNLGGFCHVWGPPCSSHRSQDAEPVPVPLVPQFPHGRSEISRCLTAPCGALGDVPGLGWGRAQGRPHCPHPGYETAALSPQKLPGNCRAISYGVIISSVLNEVKPLPGTF